MRSQYMHRSSKSLEEVTQSPSLSLLHTPAGHRQENQSHHTAQVSKLVSLWERIGGRESLCAINKTW